MKKTWKKLEENCNFPFLGKFLHHWKKKWWNMIKKMIKNDKNMIKNDKKMIKNEDDKINDKKWWMQW